MAENRYEKFGNLERERTLHQSKVQTDLTRDIVELGQELERGKLSEHQAIRILKNMYDYEMDERKLTYDMLNKIINH
jgi:hypothetical protein|tara:strand:- start:885 stop:1115 length:231 start_codon:yes stop_codon:yes gene_type:complete